MFNNNFHKDYCFLFDKIKGEKLRFLRYIFCALLFVTASVAETININWMDGNTTYAQTTCEIGGDIILPTTPTKRGYTFKGWVAGYTRLEYVESTGTEYIDTGYIFTSENEKITADFQVTNLAYGIQDKFLLGTQNTDISKGGLWVEQYRYSSSSTARNWYVRFGSSASVFGLADNENARYQIELSKNTFKLYSGDTLIGSLSPDWGGTFQNTPLTIFGRLNVAGGEFIGTPSKFWSFKIKNGDTLTLSLIPAKRNSDGVVGMYDLVSQTFFTNAGTGNFIAGPVAENQNFMNKGM